MAKKTLITRIGPAPTLDEHLATKAYVDGSATGEANTASNDGAGEGLAVTKVGVDLPFKSLIGGTSVTLSSDAVEVTINATIPAGSGDGMDDQAEANIAPVADAAESSFNALKFYQFVTLPTAFNYYRVSGIEWKNGTVVSGGIICGVDKVNADPPTLAGTVLLACGTEVAQAGTSAIQRNSEISSQLIAGGTLVGIWLQIDNGTGLLRVLGGQTDNNHFKSEVFSDNPTNQGSIAWSTSASRLYLKLYLIPIGKAL